MGIREEIDKYKKKVNTIKESYPAIMSLASKVGTGQINKITPEEWQAGINIYREIRQEPVGKISASLLQKTPIGKNVRESYKENVPINIRMAVRGIENSVPGVEVKPWTEKDMTPQELAQLQTVVRDSKVYPLIDAKKRQIVPDAFGYENYSPESYVFFRNRWEKPPGELIKETYNNPNFALMTGIGKGYIEYDSNGNPHVIDTYNFNDVGGTETGYGSLHKLVRTNIEDYPVDVTVPNKRLPFAPVYNNYFPDYNLSREQLYNKQRAKYVD